MRGNSQRIHDLLLEGRPEVQVTLMVNPKAGEATAGLPRIHHASPPCSAGSSHPSEKRADDDMVLEPKDYSRRLHTIRVTAG